MHYLYVLQFKNDLGFYVGQTKDLNIRLKEHRQGKTKSIQHRGEFILVYYEAYKSKKDATKREWKIKHYAKVKKDLIGSIENSLISKDK
ncbi:MAG: GIY-YIG nuclease family protein [Patescibacteria group bacterium]